MAVVSCWFWREYNVCSKIHTYEGSFCLNHLTGAQTHFYRLKKKKNGQEGLIFSNPPALFPWSDFLRSTQLFSESFQDNSILKEQWRSEGQRHGIPWRISPCMPTIHPAFQATTRSCGNLKLMESKFYLIGQSIHSQKYFITKTISHCKLTFGKMLWLF